LFVFAQPQPHIFGELSGDSTISEAGGTAR
jgi:hypothetical protein